MHPSTASTIQFLWWEGSQPLPFGETRSRRYRRRPAPITPRRQQGGPGDFRVIGGLKPSACRNPLKKSNTPYHPCMTYFFLHLGSFFGVNEGKES